LNANKKTAYFPKIILTMAAPIFRSTPDLVIGIPVSLAIFCFACVIPTKRFHEIAMNAKSQTENDNLSSWLFHQTFKNQNNILIKMKSLS